jgi:hypothetical protein
MDTQRERKSREKEMGGSENKSPVYLENTPEPLPTQYTHSPSAPSQSSPLPSQLYNRILYAFPHRLHSFLALPNNSFLRMFIHFMNYLQHRLSNTGPFFLLLMNSNVEGNVSILPVGHLLGFSSHKQSTTEYIYMGNVEMVVFFLLTVK